MYGCGPIAGTGRSTVLCLNILQGVASPAHYAINISMARMYGISGAWRSIQSDLPDLGVEIAHPQDIAKVLSKLKLTYTERVENIARIVEARIQDQENSVLRIEDTAKSNIAAREAQAKDTCDQIANKLNQLRAATGPLNSLLKPFLFIAPHIKRRLLIRDLEEYRASQNRQAISARNQLNCLIGDKESNICRQRQALDDVMERVNAVLQSQELAGALAEMEVARCLSMLPNAYHVFSDVMLEADHFMRFDGEPLQSAQVDYAVLSPYGVFIVEVKNWSARFAESGDYHNPYAQVSRARFLCQVLLRDRGHDVKVRGLIASAGQLPPREAGQYTKVLRPTDLIGYITWFRDKPFLADSFNEIRDFLELRVQ